MKLYFTFSIALLLCINVFAQESTASKNTLNNQFRALYKNSNNYQEYKVVKKKDYGILHNNVLDSLKGYRKSLLTKNNVINTQKATIDTLEKEKNDTTLKLNTALEKENTIAFFGISLSKSMYSILLFSTIFILLIFLAFFIYKFKNSNVLTVAAKSNLEDVENEFNLFRKKSLEREQKLRRELQDEIIKNRNN